VWQKYSFYFDRINKMFCGWRQRVMSVLVPRITAGWFPHKSLHFEHCSSSHAKRNTFASACRRFGWKGEMWTVVTRSAQLLLLFHTAKIDARRRHTVTCKRTLFVLFYVPSDTSVQATSHAINNTSSSESSNVQIRLLTVHCCNCLQRCKLNNAV